jgi:hypothetical protein
VLELTFHASLVAVCIWRFPRFTSRETGNEAAMGLLWVLVLLLIIFALVGGFAVSNWLFVILIIALILLLVGYV